MMVPNTDLLRGVSTYDASGRPRTGQFPGYTVPSEKRRRGRGCGLASLFQFILKRTRPQLTLIDAGHR